MKSGLKVVTLPQTFAMNEVATYAAMKSGLKEVWFGAMSSSYVVATYAAMKSGLKAPPFFIFV